MDYVIAVCSLYQFNDRKLSFSTENVQVHDKMRRKFVAYLQIR